MKTSPLPFRAFALVFLAAGSAGCGMFAEPDSVLPVDDTPVPTRGSSDEAAPPPLAGTPVVSELNESFGVFVASGAAAGGDGTRARPFTTITEGLAAAKPTSKRVYVCEGTYREAIVVADGVSMVGGLDCSSATWALGNTRTRIEAPTSPAITASSITKPTRFERFDVSAPDGTAKDRSSIAFFATNAAAITIANSRIAAGNGANGADGVEPAATIPSGDPDGRAGMTMREYCWWTADKACWNSYGFEAELGGAGGSIKCNGVAANDGAMGGSGGVWESVLAPGQTQRFWVAKNGLASSAGNAGREDVALTAASGVSPASGTWSRAGFAPGDGTAGENGANGRSGDGGNGSPPTTSAENKYYWYGSQGSGGGAGGCGGIAGTPGEGGGASVAAFVVDGAMTFIASELVAKHGGTGGRGTVGSAPTAGGRGGPMIDNIPSTKGQDGSPGKRAGASGSGADGSSVAVVHFGAKPVFEKTTLAFETRETIAF
jgi:hypothetical protein